jgi:hypothetical protein
MEERKLGCKVFLVDVKLQFVSIGTMVDMSTDQLYPHLGSKGRRIQDMFRCRPGTERVVYSIYPRFNDSLHSPALSRLRLYYISQPKIV